MVSDLSYQCRDVLLHLRARRPAQDLLFAAAGPASREMRPPPDSFYHHAAEYVEFAFVVRGQVRIATPAETFRLTPGKLLVIQRGVYHAELSPAAGDEYHIHWCHFEKTRVHLSLLKRTADSALIYPEWDLTGRTNVETVADAVVYELSARGWDYPSAVAGILEYLTCILIRRALRATALPGPAWEAPTIGIDPKKSALIRAALDFCDAHFREGVTQDDIAKAMGCNPRYLGRLVSSCLGHSLTRHLRNLRIAEARHLLQDTDLPVSTIAAAVGYPYPAHFTRAFMRDTGVNPESFRRRLGRS